MVNWNWWVVILSAYKSIGKCIWTFYENRPQQPSPLFLSSFLSLTLLLFFPSFIWVLLDSIKGELSELPYQRGKRAVVRWFINWKRERKIRREGTWRGWDGCEWGGEWVALGWRLVVFLLRRWLRSGGSSGGGCWVVEQKKNKEVKDWNFRFQILYIDCIFCILFVMCNAISNSNSSIYRGIAISKDVFSELTIQNHVHPWIFKKTRSSTSYFLGEFQWV